MRILTAMRMRLLGGSLLLLAGLIAIPVIAQPPMKGETPKNPAPFKFPSGTIIIVTDKLSDTPQKGDAIYLTPEKFKELLDQNEQYKKLLAASDKPMPPSECRLEGRLEVRGGQTLVRIKTTLRFKTSTSRSVIYLGFQNAQPLDPKIDDGKLPLLVKNEQGLIALIDSAGEHTLKLELETPLISRGSKGTESGFELGLPGCPISMMTFALPAKIKRISSIRREVGSATSESRNYTSEQLKPDGEGLPLGAVSNLELFWEDLEAVPKDQQRTASTETQVTLSESELLTESKLRLKGSAKEWKFTAPANAEILVRKAPLASDPQAKATDLPFEQSPTIVRPEPNQPPIWKLQFREPNAVELQVQINTRMTRPPLSDPKSKGPYSLGPYAALEVVSQSGTIRVKSPSQLRITPLLKGDTRRQDSGDDPLAEAVFRYTSLPTAGNNLPGSPLDIEVRTVPGSIQSNSTHQLQQVERGWRLRSEIQINPIRVEVDRLEVEMPSLTDFQDAIILPAELVEGTAPVRELSPQRRVIQVKLLTPQRTPFNLTIEGIYPLPGNLHESTLNLPRLLHTLERDSQVSVVLPEGLEIRGGVRIWQNDKIGTWLHPLKAEETRATVSLSRSSPAQVEFSWKPPQPHFRVESIADVLLMDGGHRVQQQLKLVFTSKPPRKLRLRLSDAPLLKSGISIAPGSLEPLEGDLWQLNLPADSGNEVTFKTSFAVREESGPKNSSLKVPLLWPEDTLQTESKVRLWRDPSSRLTSVPSKPQGNWQERPLEMVAEERMLPLSVLSSFERFAPLSLEWQAETEGNSIRLPVQAWGDRLLMQVQVMDGLQRYRLRVPLRKWTGRQIELDLPTQVNEVEVFLNGKHVEWTEAPRPGDPSKGMVIPLTQYTGEPLLLEVRYQIPTTGNWLWRLTPPRFRGNVSLGSIRWQASIPPRLTPLCLSESTIFEERWTLQNGLPVAVAARRTTELEAWLVSGIETPPSELSWEMNEGGLTFRQASLESVRLLGVPRLMWLISISAMVLLGGLLLSRLSRGLVWLLAAMLGMGGLVLFFLWPQLIRQALAASLPGVGVVFFVVMVQRYLQWRYRWRLANMPNFRRPVPESSLVRSGSSPRPAIALNRDPSTIDNPP